MNYRNYTRDPWDNFKKALDVFELAIDDLNYDPLSGEIGGFSKNHWDEESLIKNNESTRFAFLYKFFILPSEIIFSDLSPNSLPHYPSPPEPPELIKNPIESELPRKNDGFFEGFLKVFGEINSVDLPKKELKNKHSEAQLELLNQLERCKSKLKKLKTAHQKKYDEAKISLKLISGSKNLEDNEKLIALIHQKFPVDESIFKNLDVTIDPETKVALLQFEFPDLFHHKLVQNFVSWNKVKFIPESKKNKLIKSCLYSLIIRSAYIAAKYRTNNNYELVVINVHQKWFDSSTGQPRSGFIASLQAPVEYLQNLVLSKLDPEACFKYLKGILTPSMENQNPIRPIFTLNKEDKRFVDNRSVGDFLEEGTNLAAMEWEDFEHLVAQLFEWEFKRNNVEVKVTRASRDRGVDAIMFDPDPLTGGKYVLQAKRYTRTVDVSAVRDLYGTIMNEGANRGILITTSSYGPDAYEFAKDKPITLVNGQHLVQMLQKHGKNYKIDIEEARRLNIDS